MSFDYDALRGKVVEYYGTVQKFGIAMQWSEATVYKKLNGIADWKRMEMLEASKLLHITKRDIPKYFFTSKVRKTEQEAT